MNIENKFIECLSVEHGAKIVEFFVKHGAKNNGNLNGNTIYYYYGVINGHLTFKSLNRVIERGGEIIKLPEENGYPKVMMVSNTCITDTSRGYKRVVFMEKQGKYLAWQYAETIEAAEKETTIASWKYAVDVPKENPQKTEMLKRVDELKTNIAEMQKQVDEIEAVAKKI
jgi:hypothetical protein